MDLYACICMGLCIVVLGVFGYLMSLRFAEQNTKLTTMFDLLNTVIQDVQMLKISNTTEKLSADMGLIRELIPESPTNEICFASNSGGWTPSFKHKIIVSDTEPNSEDEEDEYNTDEDDDDESTDKVIKKVVESDSDTDEHPEEDLYDIDTSISIVEAVSNTDDVRTIIYPINELSESPHTDTLDLHITKTDDIPSIPPEPTDEPIVISVAENTITLTHIDDPDEVEEDKTDLGKLDVSQLRKLVSDKKLASNPSKMKKKELLHILSSK